MSNLGKIFSRVESDLSHLTELLCVISCKLNPLRIGDNLSLNFVDTKLHKVGLSNPYDVQFVENLNFQKFAVKSIMFFFQSEGKIPPEAFV